MRILAAITHYGDRNRQHLDRLLAAYRAMRFEVDIVILSKRPRSFEADITVRVGLPNREPWSLPFAHKALFAE